MHQKAETDENELRKFETYQNQRVWMGLFKDVLFPHERPNWSDKDGKVKLPRDSILLPVDGDWKWQTEWIVEIDNNFHDKKGWSYANDFNGPFKRSRGLFDLVRRRKWVRYAIRPQAAPSMLGPQHLDRRSSQMIDTLDSRLGPVAADPRVDNRYFATESGFTQRQKVPSHIEAETKKRR